jgi:hypothetical protein
MFISSILRVRTIVAVVAALIVAVTAYGFAASNTVPDTNAGDGEGTISGYTVSNVTYTLNSTDPSLLDSVSMTITPDNGGTAPTTVKVQLVNGGTWYDADGSGTSWSVDLSAVTPSVTAASVDNLRVVAAN